MSSFSSQPTSQPFGVTVYILVTVETYMCVVVTDQFHLQCGDFGYYYNYYTTTSAVYGPLDFVRDYSGEPVPER